MTKRSIPWGRLLAEGAVIIVGVLIALAGDRFVRGLEEREQESAYLQRLLAEFEAAESELLASAELAATRRRGAERVVAALEGTLPDSVPDRDLLLGMALAHWIVNPQIPREAWDDIIATGRAGLIESESLRGEIAAFYRQVALQEGFHDEWETYVLPYRTEVGAILDARTQLAVAQYRIEETPLDEGLIPSRESLVTDLRSRPDMAGLLGEVLVVNYAGEWQYGVLADVAADVTGRIRDELERNGP